MCITFNGYHGTNKAHIDNILEKGFKNSLGNDEWLGDGSYFFIEGISKTPEIQAENWAILSAWDKVKKKNKYNDYSVLSTKISVSNDKFLDLTTPEGVEILDYIQNSCQKILSEKRVKLNYIDGFLINFARGEKLFDIDVAKGNFYIKLNKNDRIFNLKRRIPNSTICSVYRKENITNIEVLKNGSI